MLRVIFSISQIYKVDPGKYDLTAEPFKMENPVRNIKLLFGAVLKKGLSAAGANLRESSFFKRKRK
jgi:hypothetical protein